MHDTDRKERCGQDQQWSLITGPQPSTGGFMAASRDVTVNKLTVDPMSGCEFSTQFVCQPTECDRAEAE